MNVMIDICINVGNGFEFSNGTKYDSVWAMIDIACIEVMHKSKAYPGFAFVYMKSGKEIMMPEESYLKILELKVNQGE